MRNKWFTIAGILAGVTLTGAGAMYLYANYKELDNIDWEIKSMNIGKSKSDLILTFTVEIKNTTDFKIKVFDYSFDVYADDLYLGVAKSDKVLEIDKNSFTTIKLPFTIKLSTFSDVVKNLNKSLSTTTKVINLMNKFLKDEEIKAAISGNAVVGFNKTIKTTINIPKLEVWSSKEE